MVAGTCTTLLRAQFTQVAQCFFCARLTVATAVVSGGELAAEVAAAVAPDAAAAAAPADAAADVPMDPAGAPGAAAVDDAPMAPVADAVFAAPSDGGCRHALTMVCSSHALVRSRCCGTPV